jgi:hypothetical protein
MIIGAQVEMKARHLLLMTVQVQTTKLKANNIYSVNITSILLI